MSLLAKAPEARLGALWRGYCETHGALPEFQWLRRPEIGAVMVRGRMGATGDAFNLGEMTVTRCSLKLRDGAVGHGYVQGRNKTKAEQAALIDALLQGEAAPGLRSAVLAPLEDEAETQTHERAAKAAATKVEFFTMVRGEDT